MKKYAMKSTVSSIFFSLLFGLISACHVSAAEVPVRPVTSAWTVEAGSSLRADSYLSPLRYRGWRAGVGLERWQAMRFNPRDWVMKYDFGVTLDRTLSPARNSVMWGIGFRASWAMMWRRHIGALSGLTLGIGPGADLDLGVLYLPRNGNNPAQAEAAVTVGATAYAIYSLRVGRLPVTFRWQPSAPLVGVFFCPDYGELYYEISLGNHAGLVHCAWPGSYRRFRSLLTADLRFGATALRLGYRADVISSRANDITGRAVSHTVTLGISGEWLMINPRRPLSADAEIISAFY